MKTQKTGNDRVISFLLLLLCLLPYLLYLGFVLRLGHGPVDYETFMEIGRRLLDHQEVYVENSYYPLPYVFVFSFFVLLPKPFSLVLWLSLPVLVALWISKGKPWVLLYAPLFSHFVGGQSSLVALLGFWGYWMKRSENSAFGGIFLSFTLLKPQLAIIPLCFAFANWIRVIICQRRIPKQAIGMLSASTLLILPSFVWMPDWPVQWLASPRPLFQRAIVGLFPRLCLFLIPDQNLVIIMSFALLLIGVTIFYFWNRQVPLDLLMVWSFVVSPLVHDYDLIQLIPVLEKRKLQRAAVFSSIPGWLTILLAYQDDKAWITFTLIAPILLGKMIISKEYGVD